MTHKIDCTLDPEFIISNETWRTGIRSWFLAQLEKFARKREIRQLLSYDDKWLEDVGLYRAKLIGELGYDPRELPSVTGAVEYHLTYGRTGRTQGQGYRKRRP